MQDPRYYPRDLTHLGYPGYVINCECPIHKRLTNGEGVLKQTL